MPIDANVDGLTVKCLIVPALVCGKYCLTITQYSADTNCHYQGVSLYCCRYYQIDLCLKMLHIALPCKYLHTYTQSNAFTFTQIHTSVHCHTQAQRDKHTSQLLLHDTQTHSHSKNSTECSSEIKSVCLSDGEPDIRPN